MPASDTPVKAIVIIGAPASAGGLNLQLFALKKNDLENPNPNNPAQPKVIAGGITIPANQISGSATLPAGIETESFYVICVDPSNQQNFLAALLTIVPG